MNWLAFSEISAMFQQSAVKAKEEKKAKTNIKTAAAIVTHN